MSCNCTRIGLSLIEIKIYRDNNLLIELRLIEIKGGLFKSIVDCCWGFRIKGCRKINILYVDLLLFYLLDLLLRNSPVGIFLQFVSVIKEK